MTLWTYRYLSTGIYLVVQKMHAVDLEIFQSKLSYDKFHVEIFIGTSLYLININGAYYNMCFHKINFRSCHIDYENIFITKFPDLL